MAMGHVELVQGLLEGLPEVLHWWLRQEGQ